METEKLFTQIVSDLYMYILHTSRHTGMLTYTCTSSSSHTNINTDAQTHKKRLNKCKTVNNSPPFLSDRMYESHNALLGVLITVKTL